ncbi:MAG: gliding motility-associated C-terminal domain-containing protein [Bacteroidia bacterium]|jgi:gliding motility-associated-like protein
MLIFQHTANAQFISRAVISSAGATANAPGMSMDWTIGEVIVETAAGTNHMLTQGFHQPDLLVIPVVKGFFIPEGFSPNNDAINDLFIITGLSIYPNNAFVIYNRWGNKVFEASPYKNDWDGKSTSGLSMGGDKLPVGTYFYLFYPGDSSPVLKGTIYLNK